MENTGAKRLYWMDALNVAACFSVIVLHCSTSVFLNTGDLRWRLDVVCQSLGIFAVPVFFMISGANLLGYREKYDTATFFLKRFKRVVVTLVVSSVVFYITTAAINCIVVGGTPSEISLRGFVSGFLQNKICDVYWFFYAIIGLYLVTPLLSLVVERKSLLKGVILASFAVTILLPCINRFLPTDLAITAFGIPVLNGYILYYMLGYYLVHCYEDGLPAWVEVLVCAVSVLMMVAMTIHTNTSHTVLSGAFADYDAFYINALSPLAALYAASLLLLFQKADVYLGPLSVYPLIKRLSGYSLGVYAIHMLVINTMGLFVPHGILVDLVIRPFIVYICSIVLVWVGKGCLSAGKRIMGIV